MDWRALQDVVAVAEAGSLSGAARRLKVTQPTVGRRIEQLEHDLGVLLFNRTAQGLSLTTVGESIIAYARRMEDEALAIERVVTGANQALQGSVRVSLIESLGIVWLPQKLAKFHQQFSELALEVNIDNRNVDLFRREADIAVRLARPEQAELICRKVGVLSFGLYASRAYLTEYGEPQRRRELKDHYHVGFDKEMHTMELIKRLELQFQPERIRHRSNSHLEMLAATTAGVGCGALCCYIADRDSNLQRILTGKMDYSREIWLVTHAEVNRSARIRAVFDFLVDALEEDAEALQGNRVC